MLAPQSVGHGLNHQHHLAHALLIAWVLSRTWNLIKMQTPRPHRNYRTIIYILTVIRMYIKM